MSVYLLIEKVYIVTLTTMEFRNNWSCHGFRLRIWNPLTDWCKKGDSYNWTKKNYCGSILSSRNIQWLHDLSFIGRMARNKLLHCYHKCFNIAVTYVASRGALNPKFHPKYTYVHRSVLLITFAFFPHIGLFHRAIMQSGSAISPWAFFKENITKVFSHAFLFASGCYFDNADSILSCLQELGSEVFAELTNRLYVSASARGYDSIEVTDSRSASKWEKRSQ